jgi:GAF domain-containing protein
MDFRVPMGKGIVGFCARQGVSLAISDAQRDERFYRNISDAIQYPTHSILCAPIQYEGRVYGCLELMNRNEGSSFTSNEVNAMTYIGRQFAEYINRLIMEREKL